MVKNGLAHRWEAGLRRRADDSFFPSRLSDPAALQEGIGHHRHQGMAMEPCPRSAFEVVQAEFLLELLMSLFADPARLDRAGQGLDRGVCRATIRVRKRDNQDENPVWGIG